jgi:hypothetical protein
VQLHSPVMKKGIVIAFLNKSENDKWFVTNFIFTAKQLCGEIHILCIFTVLIQLFYPTYILQINYSTLFVFVTQNKLQNNRCDVKQHALLMDIATTHAP